MPNFISEYSQLHIDDLRKIRGYSFNSLFRAPRNIPDEPGVYIWRYWPTIKQTDYEYLVRRLNEIADEYPTRQDVLEGNRTEVTINYFPFGRDDDGKFFGVKNINKVSKFDEYLKFSESAREALVHTIELLFSNAAPLYVGKAQSLRSRLIDHFDGRTNLLADISYANLKLEDVFISYIKGSFSTDETENASIIEEVMQRITCPIFTKRIG